ncbi:hypothetical protein WA026_005818 [Henosepilachna vigintioctopunctata]|uniref:Uncharacterized protein n=1 Tax=Henosepilachna vigintioctopunctata TaxID=420089 RepID=A0AAW1U217_9CUCU
MTVNLISSFHRILSGIELFAFTFYIGQSRKLSEMTLTVPWLYTLSNLSKKIGCILKFSFMFSKSSLPVVLNKRHFGQLNCFLYLSLTYFNIFGNLSVANKEEAFRILPYFIR